MEGTNVGAKIELPSNGYLYADDDPLRSGVVEISPIKAKDEKILSSTTNKDMVIDNLLRRCILTEGIKYNEMLVTDKLYILLSLRSISYGNQYSQICTCSNCSENFPHDIDFFKSFKVMRLEEKDVEPYEIKLPKCGNTVQFRMLRVKDELDIKRYTKQSIKSNEGDPSYCYRLAKHIVSIDGKETDSIKAIQFIENLIGIDSSAFKDAIESKESGVNIQLNISCPFCGSQSDQMLKFTQEFFRPKSPKV